MTFMLPDNLPKLMREAGLPVTEIDGWRTRGRPASSGGFAPVGVDNHHTGARDVLGDFPDDLSYAKWMFLTGRPSDGLPPPLVQLSLSLEGRLFIGAAGRANHAGVARAAGSVAAGDGNKLYVGIEWMLSGTQPIPTSMMRAGATANAVLLGVLGTSVRTVQCHWNTSVTGKWDIGDPNGIPYHGQMVLDTHKFQRLVQSVIDDAKTPTPVVTRVDRARALLRLAAAKSESAARKAKIKEALAELPEH